MAVLSREKPGGDLLIAHFANTDPTGMTIVFRGPAGWRLDPGDGSGAQEIGEDGAVVHTYAGAGPKPWVFRAQLIDDGDRTRGTLRFETPRMNSDPIAVQRAVFGAGVP